MPYAGQCQLFAILLPRDIRVNQESNGRGINKRELGDIQHEEWFRMGFPDLLESHQMFENQGTSNRNDARSRVGTIADFDGKVFSEHMQVLYSDSISVNNQRQCRLF